MHTDFELRLRGPDEFGVAYTALDEVDLAKLRAVSQAFARFAGIDADDLMQESIVRVLEGTRPWPPEVDLLPFLKGVMRSVASAAAEWRGMSPVRQATSVYGPLGELKIDVEDGAPAPEEVLISKAECIRIERDLFAICQHDEAASLILMGLYESLQGESLRDLSGLSVVEFASKRRWVRRQINAYLKGSGKS